MSLNRREFLSVVGRAALATGFAIEGNKIKPIKQLLCEAGKVPEKGLPGVKGGISVGELGEQISNGTLPSNFMYPHLPEGLSDDAVWYGTKELRLFPALFGKNQISRETVGEIAEYWRLSSSLVDPRANISNASLALKVDTEDVQSAANLYGTTLEEQVKDALNGKASRQISGFSGEMFFRDAPDVHVGIHIPYDLASATQAIVNNPKIPYLIHVDMVQLAQYPPIKISNRQVTDLSAENPSLDINHHLVVRGYLVGGDGFITIPESDIRKWETVCPEAIGFEKAKYTALFASGKLIVTPLLAKLGNVDWFTYRNNVFIPAKHPSELP